MITRTPAPDRLVDDDGQVTYGVFDGPLRRIDLDCARIHKRRLPLWRARSRFRLKEWQHFTLDLPGFFGTFAIVDSKFLKVSWFHGVERPGGEGFEHGRKGPLLKTRLARELFDDHTRVRARGYRIEVHNNLDAGEHRIVVDIAREGDRPAIRGELRCLHDRSRVTPMVVVLEVGPNRGMYSHKVPLPLVGDLQVGDRTFRASAKDSQAILDIHKAHYPRHTWWNWATCAGRDTEGRLVGLNLTHNVARDEERLNENGLWIDGELHHLGPARFEFDKQRVLEPWRLTTTDGAVDVRFEPEGERCDDIDIGPIRSVFHQPLGRFNGTVTLPGGDVVTLEDLYGVCEDHDAKW